MSQYVLLIFDDERKDANDETDQERFLRQFESYKALRNQIGAQAAIEALLADDEESEIRKRRNQE